MSEQEGRTSRKRILVVDDDPHHNRIVKDLLEHEGYEVKTAMSTRQAVAEHWDFEPDLALLDIMMPKLDGYTACDTLRKVHPDLPIVMLSAKDQSEDIKEAWDWGASYYLTKPFDPQELLDTVRRMLEESADNEPE
ncbi:MAG: response regulator transcription factor [Candidatus Latescibacterota bacterium]|nr:MAG: response regulator transcription factor [Candidatus Latescibacterota bacterium]